MPHRLVALLLVAALVLAAGLATWQVLVDDGSGAGSGSGSGSGDRSEGYDGPGVAASTPDGSLSFRIPTGWTAERCSEIDGDCVAFTRADSEPLTVGVLAPKPGEDTVVDLLLDPASAQQLGAQPITVAGRDARALVTDGRTVVAGRVSPKGDPFVVSCPPGEAGADACAVVLGTLTLR